LRITAITLTADERREIADRTSKDPRVVAAFFNALGAHRSARCDDVQAVRLAFRDQAGLYREVYHEKMEEYVAEVGSDYRKRLEVAKKWGSSLRFKTKSGIRVRSKAEKIIADFLFEKGIEFAYEPIANLGGFYVVPDFYLADYDFCLEHFGLEQQEYTKSAASKLGRYRQCKVRVVCTYAAEEPDIEEILTQKLREAGVPI
jgi:dGTP triphosphohydrolase